MEIVLPKKLNSTEEVTVDSKSIVVIGANGAGKTRFGSDIETRYNDRTHRISAQKSLSMPEQASPTSKENAEKGFLYGNERYQLANKMHGRWRSKPNTFLLDDYEQLMVLLHTEEYEESIEFKEAYSPGQKNTKPVTKLDRIQKILEEVLPYIKLIKKAGAIETHPIGSPDKNYNAAEMSDGERVIFYLIGAVISAPGDSIIIIDEPEMHIHRSIIKHLWDKIEQERPDCAFVYLTHDVDFASSRQDSTTIWAKAFDGTSWDYEVLPDNLDFPEHLYFEILGSRKPILFIEGDDSSIDYKLFQLVFSDHTIKPVGSCAKVFEITRSFAGQESFHRLESSGLIDRDRRTDEEISKISHPNIRVVDVAEVENLLLLEEIISEVACAMMKDPAEVFGKVKNNVIEFFKREIDYQAVQHVISRIDRIFKGAANHKDTRTFGDLELKLNSFWKSQKFKETYDDIKSTFDGLVKANDYDGILKVFNNKGLLPESKVAELCGLSSKHNAYQNYILSTLKQGSTVSDAIRNAIIAKIRNASR